MIPPSTSVPDVADAFRDELTGRRDGAQLVFGPIVRNDGDACARCVVLWGRDNRAASGVSEPPAIEIELFPQLRETLEANARADPDAYRGRTRTWDPFTGELSWDHVVPHPQCSCRPRPERTPWAAVRDALDAPDQLDPASWRVRALDASALHAAVVDPRWGPVIGVSREEDSTVALTRARALLPGEGAAIEGFGRATDFGSSAMTATLEAVERQMSATPIEGVTPMTVAAFDDLPGLRLDPRSLGEHVPGAHEHPASQLVAFDPTLPTSWVRGWSTLHNQPIQVPAHVAYWRVHDGRPKFVFESSSGSAMGGSRLEAILYGLFEVIERDAFLLMWHARVGLPAVSWHHLADVRASSLRLAAAGMRLTVLDATTEFSVPVAIAVIEADVESVSRGAARALTVAAGAHLDPDRAIRAAVDEAVTTALMHPVWRRRHPDLYAPQRFLPMLTDFSSISTLEDHEGVFALNEARPLWSFFERHGSSGDAPESHPHPPQPGSIPLRSRVAELIEGFHVRGMDVIVVDQTVPEIGERLGLATVKVIVPGMLAMTFGHLHTRVVGSARLARADQSLARALTRADVPATPIPHPFP